VAERRVVAVFGYSRGRSRELHPICAERLAHAARISDGAGAVVLSGRDEAELMHAAWTGMETTFGLDHDARQTVTNALNAIRSARELEADVLVVVTPSWDRWRALRLLRAAAPEGLTVSVEAAPGRPAPLRVAREALCLLLLPLQLAWTSRARRTR